MAKLESYEGLPYAYRPLDPTSQRFHLRRKRVFRMILVFLLMCGVLGYAYLKWAGDSRAASEGGGFGVMLQSWWQGGKDTGSGIISGNKFNDKLTENIKRESMKQDSTKRDSSSKDGLKRDPFVEVPLESRTRSKKAVQKKDDSWYALINPIISPSLVVVFARTGLEQFSAFFLERIAPMLDTLISRRQLSALERTFYALEKREIGVEDALRKTVIPVMNTVGIAFVTLFPELGLEVLDSGEEFIKGMTIWIDSADPTFILKYGTDTVAEGVTYVLGKIIILTRASMYNSLLGLSTNMVPMTSRKLQDFIFDLFKGHEEAHDPYAWLGALQNAPRVPAWFPTWDDLRDDGIELAKGIAGLKAQETLASTLASSFSNYMQGGNDKPGKSGPSSEGGRPLESPLANMATSLLSNMMTNTMGGKAGNENNPLVDMAGALFGGGNTKKDGKEESPLENLMDSFLHPPLKESHKGKEDSTTKGNSSSGEEIY